MSVYFIAAGGYFKIGYSEDPQRRVDRLDASGTRYTFPPNVSLSAADRSLYRAVEGWKDAEARIQDALSDFSVGLEWFLDEPEVRSFIDALPDDCEDVRPERVSRPGGPADAEYEAVQHGRAVRETERFFATRRNASKQVAS